ncbi:hypothetical protein BASA81_008419 [Batrachochytrium salamandrivorans]|nr:hypothetical protein BASA81_008419 [Batrachochytrium salamandrivorans]
MVVIQRADTLQWAIPGGMVDQGEQVSLTLKREFVEETRNLADANESELEGGDDAVKAKWADVSDNEPEFRNLYASHRDMVIRALLKDPSKFGAAIAKTSLL